MPFITQGKTNLKYILIVVVLAVIVGGGILGYYYSLIKGLEVKLTELELRLSSKVTEDETVNWKIYRYDQYGFQISYPSDWTPGISTGFEPGALGFNSPIDTQGNFMSLGIQRYDLEKGGFGYPPETLATSNTVVGGVKAYKDEGYVRNPDGPSTQSIWLVKDNFVYSLTFQVFKKYNLPSKYKYEDIKPARFTPEEEGLRDAFISTFKFIK